MPIHINAQLNSELLLTTRLLHCQVNKSKFFKKFINRGSTFDVMKQSNSTARLPARCQQILQKNSVNLFLFHIEFDIKLYLLKHHVFGETHNLCNGKLRNPVRVY